MSQPEEAIRTLEQHRCAAISSGDLQALKDLLSDDYQHIHADGRLEDLETYLAGLNERPRVVERDQFDVRLHGNTAILTGEQINRAGEAELRLVVLQVALKREGKWRFVATQAVRKAG